MTDQTIKKSAILMLLIFIISLVGWGYFWRSQGYNLAYNDDEVLWSKNRVRLYAPADKSTIFIGCSRHYRLHRHSF